MRKQNHVDRLPVDSDIQVDDTPTGPTRPLHLRLSYLGLIVIGGAIGTATREGLALTWPTPVGGFPLTIFMVNVIGAFCLGFLLESLTRRGADEGHRRTLRLLVGTGMLGGFTTYSSFATGTADLTGTALGVAFGYAAATVIVGLAASIGGVAAGTLLHRVISRQDAP